jgi:hypothetical protein
VTSAGEHATILGRIERQVVSRLRESVPLLHANGTAFWGLEWDALRWLEENVRPELATLETGAGASTIVFAGARSAHDAITPSADEVERIRTECRRVGVDPSRVLFHLGESHKILPSLEPRMLDIALIGGADGFPYPILDWWHIAPRLRVGGYLLVDTPYHPAGSALVDHLRTDPAWRIVTALGYRTVLSEKLGDEPPRQLFAGEPGIGRSAFGYLPPGRRAVASTRHRIFTTSVGLAAVRWMRCHQAWLWRDR